MSHVDTLGVFDYESDSPGLPGALHAQRSLGEGITSGSAFLSGRDNRRHPRTHDNVSHSVTGTLYTNLCTTTAALRSSMCITPFRRAVEKFEEGCGMDRNNWQVQLLIGSRGECHHSGDATRPARTASPGHNKLVRSAVVKQLFRTLHHYTSLGLNLSHHDNASMLRECNHHALLDLGSSILAS